MRFTPTLLLSAAMAALANAQAYFTMSSLPNNITPGTNYDISWLNGQGTSTVTIFLVQGTSQNLQTIMSIACEYFPHIYAALLTSNRIDPWHGHFVCHWDQQLHLFQ